MISWLARRVAVSAFLIFVLLSAVFFIVRLAPGDPMDQVVEENLGPDDRELIRRQMGLDESLPSQYLHWLAASSRGDFGTSLSQQRSVGHIIGEALPATLLLTVTAYLLHLLLALGAAVAMVARPGRSLDHWIQGVGLTLYSLPAFWLGLMMIMLLSGKLGWFPAGGMHAPDSRYLDWWPWLVDLAHHLVLPVATLALGSFIGTARYLRTSLADVLGQDYILAARARGLSERRILFRHALRNALLPMITLLGLSLPFLLGGAVVVEVVFGWPGMGRVAIEAIWARDYPVIMATTLVSAVTVVAGSLLADILYRWADPRVRHTERESA
ncbi:MAG: ABC transporter permease [Candidatus Krumholzibacteria bacterium]|nr:ABC transporter permease [Candidatus Krumholzibacteria bacterium]